MTKVGQLADEGKRAHEVILWDRDEWYDVKDEIVQALQKKKDLKVETRPYHSPGSYGDGGETYIEPSSRLYINLSW